MLITKTSIISGITRTREIDITEDQLRRLGGAELIQNVVPHLSADDREFLMTGITDGEWEALWEDPDDDDDDEELAF